VVNPEAFGVKSELRAQFIFQAPSSNWRGENLSLRYRQYRRRGCWPFFSDYRLGMRKVLKSDQRPFEIKPQQESVWICMCGLSKNQPFCDGSHKTTRDEEDGKTYEYDAEGHRHEV
jgi:CDGSH-type Zn-finger protein